jgi:chemotaxis protein MotB
MSDAYDDYPRPRKSSKGWLGWLLFVLVLVLAGAFVYYFHLPLRQARVRLESDVARGQDRERAAADRLKRSEERYAEAQKDLTKISGELQQTVAEKEKIESELKAIQGELSKKLEPEIQEGNVRIRRRGQDLVLDMADQILFDKGEAEVNDRGKKVLAQVAQSVRELRTYTLQVTGHTDGTRVVSPETQERFPTNWELSTARATNVVRFLQERGKIPGERLGAAGFAEFRPEASNASEEGRQKNRRIEVLLQPRKAEDPGTKVQ